MRIHVHLSIVVLDCWLRKVPKYKSVAVVVEQSESARFSMLDVRGARRIIKTKSRYRLKLAKFELQK